MSAQTKGLVIGMSGLLIALAVGNTLQLPTWEKALAVMGTSVGVSLLVLFIIRAAKL